MPEVTRPPRVQVFAPPPPWCDLDPAELRLVRLALAPWPKAEIERRVAVAPLTHWRMRGRVCAKLGAADFCEVLRRARADGLPPEE